MPLPIPICITLCNANDWCVQRSRLCALSLAAGNGAPSACVSSERRRRPLDERIVRRQAGSPPPPQSGQQRRRRRADCMSGAFSPCNMVAATGCGARILSGRCERTSAQMANASAHFVRLSKLVLAQTRVCVADRVSRPRRLARLNSAAPPSGSHSNSSSQE